MISRSACSKKWNFCPDEGKSRRLFNSSWWKSKNETDVTFSHMYGTFASKWHRKFHENSITGVKNHSSSLFWDVFNVFGPKWHPGIHIFGPGRSKTSPAGPPGQPGRPVGCFAGGEGGKSAGEGQRRGEAGAPPLLSPQVGYLVKEI